MTHYPDVDRRTVLKGVGGLAVVGSLAGCSTDGSGGSGGDGGGSGGDGGSGGGSDGGSGGGNAEVDDYLSATSNYDGIHDMTGQDAVTVDVGVEANGDYYGFGPAAISVDQGTTVTWEWTGRGSTHDVTHEGGDFQSEISAEEGHTFEHTFEDTGTYRYVCSPHQAMNMNGAVVVE